jgi:thioesterase domain-containing protein
LPGLGGGVLDFGELARLLGDDQPVYGLQAQGHDGLLPAHDTIEGLAANLLDAIRRIQPSGPYHLGGYSFGGVVAYEVACQLRRLDESVGLLAIFDGYAPRRSYAHDRVWNNPRLVIHFIRNLPFWLVDFVRQTRQYGRRYPRRLLRQLRARWDSGAAPDLLDAVESPQSLPKHILEIMALHFSASRAYQPLPYDGVLTLLRIRSQSLTRTPDPMRGWGRLAAGGVVLRYITGSHNNILVQPHVRSLAQALRECLAENRVSASNSAARAAFTAHRP